ncbi:FAD-binding oxidoreductase [Ornithinimicrobium sp. W1679]|uniref:FAD-binding oxidoreductase n=1 Tax=Ornithinimicrobium sp. W1679 TaxID=3418770 RepID=UPI003CEAD75F
MDVEELAGRVRGAVLTDGTPGYDEARALWNARMDRHPHAVVRCRDRDDVVETVRWAAREGCPVYVKGGGHSYAGHTVGDDGVLLDLSGLSGIKVHVDQRRATVQGGATWAALDAATQHHGLATTGPTVSSVGVAGSVLGGATGWLSRAFGHGVDNLLSVEVVTTNGEVVTASPASEPDLFWGMRGGGATLGVVTSLDLALHEVGPQVLAGQVIYPFDDAERMLTQVADVMRTAPEELQCLPFTFRVPPVDAFPAEWHGRPVLDLVVFHTSPDAVDALAPLRELGTPMLDTVGPAPYTAVQQAFDANLPGGQRYYSVAHDLPDLSEEAASTFARHVRTMEGAFTVAYLEPKGGAAGRVEPTSTAMGGRDAAYGFHIIAGWSDPGEDGSVMGWARDFGRAMAEHATGGVYVNLIAEDEGHRIPDAFSDVDRLRDLKGTWDPDDLLRGNYDVAPRAGDLGGHASS